MGQDQFDRLGRPAADPAAHGLAKARLFPFERGVHQVIFGREAIDETALADAGTRGDGIERETSATGLKNQASAASKILSRSISFFRVKIDLVVSALRSGHL